MDSYDTFGIVLLLVVLFFVFLKICYDCVIIVRHQTVCVVERFGKFKQVLQPGLHCITPLVERVRPLKWRNWTSEIRSNGKGRTHIDEEFLRAVDLRENVMDLPLQHVITRDNVEIFIHPIAFYRIAYPLRAVYETTDLTQAVSTLLQTALRGVVGSMGLDDTLASREEINRILMRKIKPICMNWGVDLLKVELLEIIPSTTIVHAMHKQLTAERWRRSELIKAEGQRKVAKTVQEGKTQATMAVASGTSRQMVIQAGGHAAGRRELAKAEAEAILFLNEALKSSGHDPVMYNIALKYLHTLEMICMSSEKKHVVFPLDTDVTGALALL
eukprot:gnl/Dysnectes_brevis/830_a915_4772.p1 GENE.gnl/Dysnectes_brevis/830_a915_4772~~gnl/Dysnectes_brevis/830_a915_4772.p1  ORF type:complete len:344 (+),score=95.41 gnl/Dysnectes_brevis/830_a915_4772:48-1034(+)